MQNLPEKLNEELVKKAQTIENRNATIERLNYDIDTLSTLITMKDIKIKDLLNVIENMQKLAALDNRMDELFCSDWMKK
jgi:predicted  nucleic acid-binding Zn-ribbon protein